MASAKKQAARLDKLVQRWEPILGRAFAESARNMRDSVQIGQMISALEARDVERAIRAAGLDATAFRPYDVAINTAFSDAGAKTAASIVMGTDAEGMRVKFKFDMRNPAAEVYLQERAVAKVVQIVEDQVIMVREHLVASLEKGVGPRAAALDIAGRVGPSGRREGGVLGLTSSQAEWVRNYRADLADDPAASLTRQLRDRRFDAAVSRAVDSGEPIPAALQEKMVTAYENRALRFRAENIARTEAMASLHEAQQQAVEQAVQAMGPGAADAVTFIWHTSEDNRVRDSHAEMDGQEVALGEKFVTGDGNYLEYPGDPDGPPSEVINCRCWREPNIDFLAGVE